MGKHYCAKCNSSFKKKSGLEEHILTSIKHNGSKVLEHFTCSVCNKGFARSQEHERHVREVHKQIRDKACDRCGQRFGRPNSLKRHKNKAKACQEIRRSSGQDDTVSMTPGQIGSSMKNTESLLVPLSRDETNPEEGHAYGQADFLPADSSNFHHGIPWIPQFDNTPIVPGGSEEGINGQFVASEIGSSTDTTHSTSLGLPQATSQVESTEYMENNTSFSAPTKNETDDSSLQEYMNQDGLNERYVPGADSPEVNSRRPEVLNIFVPRLTLTPPTDIGNETVDVYGATDLEVNGQYFAQDQDDITHAIGPARLETVDHKSIGEWSDLFLIDSDLINDNTWDVPAPGPVNGSRSDDPYGFGTENDANEGL